MLQDLNTKNRSLFMKIQGIHKYCLAIVFSQENKYFLFAVKQPLLLLMKKAQRLQDQFLLNIFCAFLLIISTDVRLLPKFSELDSITSDRWKKNYSVLKRILPVVTKYLLIFKLSHFSRASFGDKTT